MREEYRVYFDRNATQNGAKRSGSAGMDRRSNAAWVLPPAVKDPLEASHPALPLPGGEPPRVRRLFRLPGILKRPPLRSVSAGGTPAGGALRAARPKRSGPSLPRERRIESRPFCSLAEPRFLCCSSLSGSFSLTGEVRGRRNANPVFLFPRIPDSLRCPASRSASMSSMACPPAAP